MPRNMSFSLTTRQMYEGTKTVTRRLGWKNVRYGEILWAVEKCQGLKKGEHIVRIRQIRVRNHWWEPLNSITQADCVREGFPELTPAQFVEMFCRANKCEPSRMVNRIEFEFAGKSGEED